MGHYSRDVFEAVRDGHAYVTNFRHPFERVVSLYNYFRFAVPIASTLSEDDEIDFHCVRAAKTLDFPDFVRNGHPNILVYISDHHFRQLSKSQWHLNDQFEEIAAVCDFIDNAACFYVCEYPDLSMRWMRSRLGLEAIPRMNSRNHLAAIRPADVDRSTYEALMELNQRDLAIYRHAVERLLQIEFPGST
jgi:hypothetical protein